MKPSILAGLLVLGLGTTAQAQQAPSLWDALEVTATPVQYYGGGGYDPYARRRDRHPPPPTTGYQPEDTRLQRGGPGLQPEDSRLIPPRRDYGGRDYDRRGYDRGDSTSTPPGGFVHCHNGRCR